LCRRPWPARSLVVLRRHKLQGLFSLSLLLALSSLAGIPGEYWRALRLPPPVATTPSSGPTPRLLRRVRASRSEEIGTLTSFSSSLLSRARGAPAPSRVGDITMASGPPPFKFLGCGGLSCSPSELGTLIYPVELFLNSPSSRSLPSSCPLSRPRKADSF